MTLARMRLLLLGLLLALVAPLAAQPVAGTTSLISAADDIEAAGASAEAVVSADGRFVAFSSSAGNLVAGDTNRARDIFVRDLETGQTERVSVTATGAQADGPALNPAISADGRYVAFESTATNLTGLATGGLRHIYVYDRVERTPTLVSVTPGGQAANGASLNPAISANGRIVAFDSYASNLVNDDTNGRRDVFVRDLSGAAGTTQLVSKLDDVQGDNDSSNPAISGDGRAVAFESAATNLLDAGPQRKIFWRLLDTSALFNASAGIDGAAPNGNSFSPSLSHDGLRVAFSSNASNLVRGDDNEYSDVFVRSFLNGTLTLVSAAPDRTAGDYTAFLAAISGDGRFVAFTSRESAQLPWQVMIRDVNRTTSALPLVSVNSTGQAADATASYAALSYDGSRVVFDSPATNLVAGDTNGVVDIFVRDRGAETTERVSLPSQGVTGNAQSRWSALAADRPYVAFMSEASNLVAEDTNGVYDIFVRNYETGAIERVSVDSDEQQANDRSVTPSVSGDGNLVAFTSVASNLVADDMNGLADIFVRDRVAGTTTLVSEAYDGTPADSQSSLPVLARDGRHIVFVSSARNLVAGGANGLLNVFVRNLEPQTTQTTRLISVGLGGAAANGETLSRPAISADGCVVAFESSASNLVAEDTNEFRDIFVYDCQSNTITRVSVAYDGGQADNGSSSPAISSDGHLVAFESSASNLVEGDTNGASDIFVYDRVTGMTSRVSVAPGGGEATGSSYNPAISGDGRLVAFEAVDLVADGTTGQSDIFVHDRATGMTSRIAVAPGGERASGISTFPAISGNGHLVAFESAAANLVADDRNGTTDIFVYATADLVAGPAYSISGRVTDSAGQGLAGVTVSAGPYRATTDADGAYRFIAVQAGNYVLTPARPGYRFSPASRAVTVNADLNGQNFTAIPAGVGEGGEPAYQVFLPLVVR